MTKEVAMIDTEIPVEVRAAADGGGQDGEESVSLGEFWHRLYQVTYSKTLGLGLILALAVLVLLGSLITQAPGDWGDQAARAGFLTQQRARYGGWTGLLSLLGLFHVFSSVPFDVVTGGLAVSILGCTTHRVPQLWRQARHPKVLVSERFFASARYRGVVEPAGEGALPRIAAGLRRARYRVIVEGDSLYADRFAWGGFGTVVAHLSFIVILAAFVISGAAGYAAVLNVPVGGDPVAVAAGLTVQATAFSATYAESGRPVDYVSHLVVRDGGGIVGEQDVRVNAPLVVGPWTFHQNSFGLAVDVTVRDDTAATLFAESVPQQWRSDDGTLAIGRFTLPERGLTVDVMTAASGAADAQLQPGQAAFVVYRDGETTAMGMTLVDQGSSAAIGDLTFAFDRESQYTGVQVRRDPGAGWMWVGSALLVLGMSVTFCCRHRRLWVEVGDGEVRLASADKEDSGFRRQFDLVVAQVPTWLKGESDAAHR